MATANIGLIGIALRDPEMKPRGRPAAESGADRSTKIPIPNFCCEGLIIIINYGVFVFCNVRTPSP